MGSSAKCEFSVEGERPDAGIDSNRCPHSFLVHENEPDIAIRPAITVIQSSLREFAVAFGTRECLFQGLIHVAFVAHPVASKEASD